MELERVFAPGGPLAEVRGALEDRPGQRRMAEAVERAFAEARSLVVEAETGTGKTLAYLVPALRRGEPVIVSTGTRALQQQIIEREVPMALAALGVTRDVCVLKGRNNYLCLKRFEEMAAAPRLDGIEDVPHWRTLSAWAAGTASGDRAEVEGLPDDSRLWARLDGRAEICLGTKCHLYESCFVVRARRRAQEAALVVVNHHLLFADLALKIEGHGQVLPEAPLLVLDEAHLAEEAAIAHFGERLSSRMVADLARDAAAELAREGRSPAEADEVGRVAQLFFGALRPPEGRGRVAFDPPEPGSKGFEAAERLDAGYEALRRALEGEGKRADERALLVARVRAQQNALESFLAGSGEDRVVTVEAIGRAGASIASWPIDVGPLLEESFSAYFRSVVATSATLSVERKLERARARLGMPRAEGLIVPSPWRPEKQASVYVPRHFPEPATREFPERSLEEIEALLDITEGRALVLFASHRALRYAAERLPGRVDYRVLVQGEAPREWLVETFREDEHSVLLGTASFRQGIDVPGAALSLVVVDKLPFAVPDDPLVRARSELVRRRGGNPFMDEQLPDAVLALKQGFGRLIRAASDRGILALLDTRVRTRRYGGVVLRSLPPWPLVEDLEELRRWFRSGS